MRRCGRRYRDPLLVGLIKGKLSLVVQNFNSYSMDCRCPRVSTPIRRDLGLLTTTQLRVILSDAIHVGRENCGDKQEEFLNRCFYHAGQYNSEESFGELSKKLHEHEVCVPFIWCVCHSCFPGALTALKDVTTFYCRWIEHQVSGTPMFCFQVWFCLCTV